MSGSCFTPKLLQHGVETCDLHGVAFDTLKTNRSIGGSAD